MPGRTRVQRHREAANLSPDRRRLGALPTSADDEACFETPRRMTSEPRPRARAKDRTRIGDSVQIPQRRRHDEPHMPCYVVR